MPIFFKLSNCRIIKAETTYFVNIQYGKIYFHHDVVLTKTCYYDSASSFWKILTFQISTVLKKAHFSQNFKLPHIYSPDYLFCKHLILQNILSQWSSLIKTSYNNSKSFFWKIFPFQISINQKCPFFLKFQIAA